jgi:hypothetical protein
VEGGGERNLYEINQTSKLNLVVRKEYTSVLAIHLYSSSGKARRMKTYCMLDHIPFLYN